MNQCFPSATAVIFVAVVACGHNTPQAATGDGPPPGGGVAPRIVQSAPGETHFRAIRQITFGGENAEAYFSNDGKWLTLQTTRDGHPCDQQYVMRIDGSNVHRITYC